MPAVRIKRGTAAQVAAAASANQLAEGELYLVTDTQRVAVGLSASMFIEVGGGSVTYQQHQKTQERLY